jgi:hypothetical protein
MFQSYLDFCTSVICRTYFEKGRIQIANAILFVFFFAGEDLLAIAADQPFRFPATFTFVVRAFSGFDLYWLVEYFKSLDHASYGSQHV